MTKRLFFALLGITMQVLLVGCKTTNPETEKTPDDIDTQLSVVASFIDAGTPDKALKEIRPIYEKNQNDARVQNMMGLVQLSLRNLERSITHFHKSYALDEKISTGLNLSAAYIELGKFADAEKTLKKVLLLKEDPAYQHPERLYLNLGIVYEKTKRVHLAEKNYRKALEENPIYYMAQVQLARLYENTKRLNLAISTMEQAHSNCRVCYEPVATLAKNYLKINRPDKTKKILDEYIKTESVATDDRIAAQNIRKDLEKTAEKEPLSSNGNR